MRRVPSGPDKQWMEVTNVYPPNKRIEGRMRDGSDQAVTIYEVPVNFRWPLIGEFWSVVKDPIDGTNWMLGSRINSQTNETGLKISTMEPGSMRLDSTDIFDGLGRRVRVEGVGATGQNFDVAPIGTILPYSGRSSRLIPEGYALANGGSFTKVNFPQGWDFAKAEADFGNTLWTYTPTSFTVPDYTDKFLLAGGALNAQGTAGGEATHILTPGETAMKAHNHGGGVHAHSINDPSHAHPYQVSRGQVTFGGFLPDITWDPLVGNNSTLNAVTGITINNSAAIINTETAANGTAHQNMPPFVAIAYIVKIAGITTSMDVVTGPPGIQGPIGNTGATGPPGSTGAPGAPGADGKTVLNGSGAPPNGTGVNGDFYVDTTNNRFYGPKAGGAWPGTFITLGGGGLVQEEGTPLTSRPAINFIGSQVTAADDAVNNRTNVTVTAAPPDPNLAPRAFSVFMS